MKFVIAIILLGTIVWLGAYQSVFAERKNANPVVITEYRIVGFTTAVTDGSVETTDASSLVVRGIVALNQMCKADFGRGARASFSNEQLAPNLIPSEAPDPAWIRPTSIRFTTETLNSGTPGETGYVAYDTASGRSSSGIFPLPTSPFAASRRLSCNDWHSHDPFPGLARRPSGFIISHFCTQAAPVTCSAAVRIRN
jgi:hypothetical protein